MPILEMTLLGDPVAKSRPRSGKNGTTYTPRRTKEAEKVLAGVAREHLGDGFVPVDVPVGIAVEFFCATMRRTDGDNLFKLVTDALNKVAYTDDFLIEEFFVRVVRGARDQARTEILLWAL